MAGWYKAFRFLIYRVQFLAKRHSTLADITGGVFAPVGRCGRHRRKPSNISVFLKLLQLLQDEMEAIKWQILIHAIGITM